MSSTKKKTAYTSIVVLVVFVFFVFIFLYFNPVKFVENIGIHNSYLLAFIVSLFGGVSAGGAISFISVLTTLVLGGLNPLWLGLIAGVSLSVGDMFIFFLGSKGRQYIVGRLDTTIRMVAEAYYKNRLLSIFTPVIAYVYMAFTPLPNDILLVFLSFIDYPINKMRLIIFLGDMTFALMLTTLVSKGVLLFI